ncbi:thermonuclease family protein [Stutzerimonas azotifigens]|uniref:Thermonuclease family protein n=1 Tax=Stutzerimonas azotifigens TaxID=291995 RepID=A0ABR5Z0U2_9GAMM|nr:thermonuclease family protein [Stutzerimonas azotifigens]
MKKAPLVGAFFVCLSSAVQASCPAPGPLPQVEVARVVDGDTLRLADGRSVRLIGLNTPELGGGGRAEEPFAVLARRELEARVRASGGRVGLQIGAEAKDRYGRALAHVYDNKGANLEAALLGEGLGYFVAQAPNVDLWQCHQAAERQARDAGRNLWRAPSVLAPDSLAQAGFALIGARVERVERNRGGVWLEFEGPAVLHIARQHLGRFDAAELDALVGRRVLARGWVIDRKGAAAGQARWMLPISHPSMLELRP